MNYEIPKHISTMAIRKGADTVYSTPTVVVEGKGDDRLTYLVTPGGDKLQIGSLVRGPTGYIVTAISIVVGPGFDGIQAPVQHRVTAYHIARKKDFNKFFQGARFFKSPNQPFVVMYEPPQEHTVTMHAMPGGGF